MNQICIVGAGPGALDLMTIRAFEKLKQAEVLVWADSLIPKAITDFAPKACERIRTSSLTLEEIIDLLVDRYKKGKRIFISATSPPTFTLENYKEVLF